MLVKAARLFGAVEVLREQTATTTPASEQALYDRSLDKAKRILGDDAFLKELQFGKTMGLDRAVQIGLEVKSGGEE